MKKLVTLLAAAGMVVAASAPANAVDVKVDYRHRISFDRQSGDFNGGNTETARQRARLGLSFAASENLGGYIQFQTAKFNYGDYNSTAGKSDAHIQVRQMYFDWTVPATDVKVRMGRQLVGFPGEALTGHNSVMDAGWGSRDGIVVSAPATDWLGLTALWVRADASSDAEDINDTRTADIFGAVADLKFDGVKAAVYAAYANLDTLNLTEGGIYNANNFASTKPIYDPELAGVEGKGYWFGATANLSTFDPFNFALSFAYGHVEADGTARDIEQSGWNVQAKASYKLGFGTPVLGAWYGSGMDADDVNATESKVGIMPSIGGYIAPTKSFHDSASSLQGGQGFYLPAGNWGVQVGIEDVSFLKDLSHTFLVTYMQGTNDKELAEGLAALDKPAQYLTEDDSLVSFDLVNTYKIYKNLAAHLELAYIINDYASVREMEDDAWRAAVTFDFKF